jgi:hypothetical protein
VAENLLDLIELSPRALRIDEGLREVCLRVELALERSRAGGLILVILARECQSEGTAIRRGEGMSRDPANAGAVAFKRAGDPNVGEFSDAVVLKKFGDVPEDLSEL